MMQARHPLLAGALSALLLVAAGCSDDTDDTSAAGGGAGDDTQDFPGCEAGELEADIMGQDGAGNPVPLAWMGAGVDPDSGELMPGDYVVSSTYLQLKPDAMQRFGELMEPIIPALFGSPGLVAVQLGLSEKCSTARTLSVWESQEAMMGFVTSDAHGAAMGAVGEVSRGGSVVTHWTAAAEEVDWDTATAAVAADDGPRY